MPADAPPLFTAVAHDDILRRIVEGVYLEWSAADRPGRDARLRSRRATASAWSSQGMPSDGWTDLFLAWLEDSGITTP